MTGTLPPCGLRSRWLSTRSGRIGSCAEATGPWLSLMGTTTASGARPAGSWSSLPRPTRRPSSPARHGVSTSSTASLFTYKRRTKMALTDQAIEKIKDLIIAGEFAPGSKLPKERELAERLGLSRNSLREAVRALTLIGVLEPRVGDGTYVTSLEPELLLTGMGFISDLLTGSTLLELHQVRRILEPVATELAATRLEEADFAALESCLEEMDAAE